MIDMFFYHDKSLYVYYNMHKHNEFNGGYDETQLCKARDKTESGPIFYDYYEITKEELAAGGNKYVVVQNLTKLIGGNIHDIVKPFKDSVIPGRVRHADINIDGFPDLFITLEIKDPISIVESSFK